LSGAEGYFESPNSSNWIHPNKPCGVNESYKPEWSGSSTTCPLLPLLELDGKAELQLKSGIYALVVKYTCNSSGQDQLNPQNTNKMEAGIIVGEMEFNSEGFVMAEGADWDRLLSNQRQTQLPYSHGARGVPMWLRRKVSEPWKDGDEIKIRVDPNENTIVFNVKKGNMPEKVFWNVLAFSNNSKNPDFIRLYAYCGGYGRGYDGKLTIM
jgi:hypothetical protein